MANQPESALLHTEAGFRSQPPLPSLSEVHRSLLVPASAGFLRKLLAFAGPGFLVAVGYMDPGNWATDLAAGSKYNYTLLSVIMISNLMAILLQALSLKLGIVTGAISRKHVAITTAVLSPSGSGRFVKSRSRPVISPKSSAPRSR